MFIKRSKQQLPNAVPTVQIEHKSETIEFSISVFGRESVIKDDFDIFEHLNAYWATLPEAQQDYIFSIYRTIRKEFSERVTDLDFSIHLSRYCTELLDAYDLEDVKSWITTKANLIIPSNFEAEYVYDFDKQGSRDQTYIRSDYIELLAMAVIIRTMIPVWGEFILQTKKRYSNLLKEYYGFRLIGNAKIMLSAPMQKLIVYIAHAIGNNNYSNTSISSGISSCEYSDWMLGLICIRRLCLCDLRGLDSNANVVTSIFKYVVQKIDATESPTNSDKVNSKNATGVDDGIEDKISSLERYKIVNSIAGGWIEEMTFSIKDLNEIAFRASPLMTNELLNSSLMSVQKLRDKDKGIRRPQMALCQWTLGNVLSAVKPECRIISAKGQEHLNKEVIINLLGITEAVLMAEGFSHMALLSTSYVDINDASMFLGGIESRARIPRKIQDELDILYPFQRTIGGYKSGIKSVNPAIHAIDEVSDMFGMYSWMITATGDKVEQVFGNRDTNRINSPYDIRIQLADIILKIVNRHHQVI